MDADTNDPDLVAAALDGDRAAIAAIYDRHADRVHDMCLHMLRDRDEAADVVAQVFVVACSRLGQLRDPGRLRPWLFAIARHEVYRRGRQRSRTRLVGGADRMDELMSAHADGPGDDDVDPADTAAVVAVLRAAADGLDDHDRVVMELQLQGLDGDELAAALGTSVSTGYQQVHRMRERLGRSVGALLVARQGRADCQDLDRLLAAWDGTFSVLWRKRVARHVDRCEVCERRRRAIPAALFGGAAAAVPMLPTSAVGAAPAAVRDRVLADATVGAPPAARGWRADGFPPADPAARRPRAAVVAAAAVALILLVVAAVLMWVADEPEQLAAIDATATTTTSTTASSSSSSSVVAPSSPVSPAPSTVPSAAPGGTPPDPSTTLAPAPTTTAAPAPPGPTVTTTVEPGPPVELTFVPRVLYQRTGGGACGASVDLVAVAGPAAEQVQLWWRDARGEDGLVQLGPTAGEWRGVVEVPESVAGPVTLVAVALDGTGRTGVSATEVVPVRGCPTPG